MIESLVKENKVMLFMKGNKMFPQCGFSNSAVQVPMTYIHKIRSKTCYHIVHARVFFFYEDGYRSRAVGFTLVEWGRPLVLCRGDLYTSPTYQ